jgi:hypothetical protein
MTMQEMGGACGGGGAGESPIAALAAAVAQARQHLMAGNTKEMLSLELLAAEAATVLAQHAGGGEHDAAILALLDELELLSRELQSAHDTLANQLRSSARHQQARHAYAPGRRG